ncbi:LPS-assembly protein LptD [Sedimenticola hydrogenitrophicus]|uniref:LPS-assembly protein LptD n=1 Tax=Sedimenticola hydrogenitrophicus TaxID=2967975 RepID=UPI0023AFA498|nr:LPS assembly protein LptD [Sedimenticola hydrogenitrophicus]
MLPLAISGLLLVPAAQAAPKWDCHASSDGGWECFQDGLLVPPEPVVIERPSDRPPTTSGSSVMQPAQGGVTTQPLEEPQTPGAVAITPMTPGGDAEQATQEEQPTSGTAAATEATTTPPMQDNVTEAPAAPVEVAPAVITTSETAASNDNQAMEQAAEAPAPSTQAETNTTASTTPVIRPQAPTAETPPATPSAPVVARRPEATMTVASSPADVARIDRGLDWSQCAAERPPRRLATPQITDTSTRIEADAADLYRSEDRAEFSGNVQVEQGNERLEADHVTYLKGSNTLDAEGNVYLEQPGLRVTGSEMHYNLNTQQGSAEQAEFRLTDPLARGNAGTAEILNPDQSRYSDVRYTTCPPGNSDWQVEAEEIEIDQASGVGVARHAKLRFKGVPFIYLPYATFPIDDRRKSGFLPPSIGSSENSGADASIPYYFNIAPNLDATFTPRIMGKRGILLGGEFRYLTEHNKGEVRAELLPSDSERGPGENSTRGALNMLLNGTPAPRWSYDINLNYVSDNDYLEDLGTSLAATSAQHQERRGDIQYFGDGWSFLGRVQQFQTIDDAIALNDRPYSRLPQLLLNLEKPDQAMGLTYHLRSEYVHFGHSSDSKVKGERFDMQPGISLPLRRPWGFTTPKLSLRHTRYSLENQTPGASDNPSRTLPTLSLDSGLYFDRGGRWFGNAITHTLEPRLFYLYTPKEDQGDLPDFDTGALDFSFANLFRENRFSGVDKVGDANQLTTALTTRGLSSASGEELFRASIGQIFYFRDREVQLNSSGAVTQEDSSSIVAEVATRLSREWRMQAGLQWNPHASGNETEKGAFGVHYLDERRRILNLTYRYTNGSIEQTDLSARWPITHRLHAVGRWNYSLLHETSMETFAGVEYESCCWVSRFVVRDYRTDADGEGNLALFLQLELKGLTSLGDKIDQFLERGILGYHTDN